MIPPLRHLRAPSVTGKCSCRVLAAHIEQQYYYHYYYYYFYYYYYYGRMIQYRSRGRGHYRVARSTVASTRTSSHARKEYKMTMGSGLCGSGAVSTYVRLHSD